MSVFLKFRMSSEELIDPKDAISIYSIEYHFSEFVLIWARQNGVILNQFIWLKRHINVSKPN